MGYTDAPLAGIRVVESTSIYSGPFAGLMLAELGAEVIKVEPTRKPDLIRNRTGADPMGVSPAFYSLNRGKKFVSIDASTAEGRALQTKLAASADVYLHNMRPGKGEAIGVGYEELAAINPRLIYVAISGLGPDSEGSELPVYDYVIQARVGMVDYQRDPESGTASLISQVLVDKTAANAAVQAVLAALLVRERTGRGQRIDIPMLGVGLAFGWPDVMSYYLSELEPMLPYDVLPRHAQLTPSSALFVLKTNDGEVAVSPALPPWDGLCIALDHPEWVIDERFAEPIPRVLNLLELRAEMQAAASGFTSAELLERFAANDVAAGPVQRRSELVNDPLIAKRIVESDATGVGTVRQPLPMWTFSDTKALVTSSMGRVGADTSAVLRELGLDDSEITRLHDAGVVASPTGAAS